VYRSCFAFFFYHHDPIGEGATELAHARLLAEALRT
jgi:hypothetical protein